MDICNEPDNVKMNTGASDDNVEKVKSSDYDDDSDESHPGLMTQFDIEEEQR